MSQSVRLSDWAPAQEAVPFVCQQDESIWAGAEKALDNSFGVVFVTDAAGALRGHATLAHIRDGIRKGGHLMGLKLGEVMRDMASVESPLGVEPVLDANGRVLSISMAGEQPFLAVSEPDLTHQEMRNVLDAFLSTWISSTGDYIRQFE
ncbi:MAG: hypothetical protein EON57_12815, partial [Alphaproteobacteria bacterium]